MRNVRILPDVLLDIAEAAAWYDENGYDGLGDRFVDTFYSSLAAFNVMVRFIEPPIKIFAGY